MIGFRVKQRGKSVLVLLCVAGAIIAVRPAYRLNCKSHESAFQARFQQLNQDVHRRLKIGMTREEVFRFLLDSGLQVESDQSRTLGFIVMSRGCGRGWNCSIGPDGGMISVSVTFNERGKVDSEAAGDIRSAMTKLENHIADADRIQSDTNRTLEMNLPVEPSTVQ